MEQVSDEVHGLRVAIRERILRIPDAVSDAGYDDLPITQLLAAVIDPRFSDGWWAASRKKTVTGVRLCGLQQPDCARIDRRSQPGSGRPS